MEHRSIRVLGHVQGVFFRQSAKQEAERLGLSGFACNEPDGSVYMEAEGETNELEQFIDWCRYGPPAARVDNVEVGMGDVQGFDEFSVR